LLSSRYEKPLKIINSYNYSGVNDGNRRWKYLVRVQKNIDAIKLKLHLQN
jgi:hypothetical protein